MRHNHRHMFGTAWTKNPPTTEQTANEFLTALVERINMNVLIGPFSVDCQSVGNEGVTGVVGLEFSHASFHSWHVVDRPFLTFDVYSCADFQSAKVTDVIDEFFGLKEVRWTVFDRNDGRNKVVEEGSLLY